MSMSFAFSVSPGTACTAIHLVPVLWANAMCAHPDDCFARYWVHGGMLMVDGVKMSKSLGNFYTIDQVLEKAPAEALRLLFLTTHYHQPFNFTFEGLEQAKQILDKFYNALLRVKDVKPSDALADERVVKALEDDLNTPLALSYFHELVNNLNKAENDADKAKWKAVLLLTFGDALFHLFFF